MKKKPDRRDYTQNGLGSHRRSESRTSPNGNISGKTTEGSESFSPRAPLLGHLVDGGHPDCNDGDRLADDPIHKLLLDRDPFSGERLASQPTLSRFENAVNGCALHRMADEFSHAGHRAASPPPERTGAVHHDRSGPDGRPDARSAAVHALQRALRQLVLAAGAWLSDLRPRIRAVSVRTTVAARQGGRLRRDDRAVGPPSRGPRQERHVDLGQLQPNAVYTTRVQRARLPRLGQRFNERRRGAVGPREHGRHGPGPAARRGRQPPRHRESATGCRSGHG